MLQNRGLAAKLFNFRATVSKNRCIFTIDNYPKVSGGKMSSNLDKPVDGIKRDENFFYNAIKNTQAIIQSVDIKLHVLLGITAILLAQVINVFYSLKFSDGTARVYYAICAIMGLVSVYYTILAIQKIRNPDDNVDRTNTLATSSFYGIPFFRGVNGKVSVREILSAFPQSDEQTLHELAYEFAKLVYIREVKIKRQNCAIRIFIAWIVILLLPMFLTLFQQIHIK